MEGLCQTSVCMWSVLCVLGAATTRVLSQEAFLADLGSWSPDHSVLMSKHGMLPLKNETFVDGIVSTQNV